MSRSSAPPAPPTASHPIGRLKRRAEFLRLRGGRARRLPSLVLQARARPGDGAAPRFGFTVSKRLGGAVRRNRTRRRLKEAVRLVAPELARPGFDYVVIGRHGALGRRFEDIVSDLRAALDKIHEDPRRERRSP